jgi:hypothetical protein
MIYNHNMTDSFANCGMSGVRTERGVDVTYSYTYGCVYKFTMHLLPSDGMKPQLLPPPNQDGCNYFVEWRVLRQ